MGNRTISMGLLVATFVVGLAVGRALAPDNDVDSATPDVSMPVSTATSTIAAPASTGPTLAELVPGLDHPIFLETANPTQLLRWDPDRPAPLPVKDIPSGVDLDMDRDARFVLVDLADQPGSILLGGLVGTPLDVLGAGIDQLATRTNFTDHFWFEQDGELVETTTRGEERSRVPIPDLSPPGPDVTPIGSPVIAFADEGGLVLEQWYTVGSETGPVAVQRVLLQRGAVLDLPGGENSFLAGMSASAVFIRTREGALTSVDRVTGVATEASYDGSCGLTQATEDGVVASVCRGMVSVFLDETINRVGTWTSGRWSGSGRWFMAVGGYFGELLLIDRTTAEPIVVRFPLTQRTLVVDVWSGA